MLCWAVNIFVNDHQLPINILWSIQRTFALKFPNFWPFCTMLRRIPVSEIQIVYPRISNHCFDSFLLGKKLDSHWVAICPDMCIISLEKHKCFVESLINASVCNSACEKKTDNQTNFPSQQHLLPINFNFQTLPQIYHVYKSRRLLSDSFPR